MIRIAVFSDTHGDLSRLDAAMRLIQPVQAIIHLGDFAADAARIAAALGLPYQAVRGNCDASDAFPAEQVVWYEKTSLLLTHGNRYGSGWMLAHETKQRHCKAALFGHSHVPLLRNEGGILLINPGSLSHPRGGSTHGFCVLAVENAELSVQMVPLPA